jgi:hypothetical protein
MSLIDALIGRFEVTDEEFAMAREHFDEAMLIDITTLVAHYMVPAFLVALARPKMDDYPKLT